MLSNRKKNDGELFVMLKEGKAHYTVKEVAQIMNVTKASVQSYITNQIIKAELINGRRMVSREALYERLTQLKKVCIYGLTFDEIIYQSSSACSNVLDRNY